MTSPSPFGHPEIGTVSVGIIAARRIPELDRLVDNLVGGAGRAASEVVVAVETPGVAKPTETSDPRGVRWIELPTGRGIGYNRSVVDHAVRGDVMVMVDDDCEPAAGWLDALVAPLENPSIDAVVGRVVIPPSTLLGDSISALGYPAGGSAGYETMFSVGEDGTTDNIASGNFAVRMSVLQEIGGFDPGMSAGGADTELAYRMVRAGKRIIYEPTAVIVHPARTDLSEFVRWFFRRGRAKYQIVQRVPHVGRLVGRRLSSYWTILGQHTADPKIVLIAPLLAASVLLQQMGFLYEWARSARRVD